MSDDIILEQLTNHFKAMLKEIMLKEREQYLKENNNTRANGYYVRTPKTILGDLELEIPRTRDGNFKPSIIPERKRVTFLLDDVVTALFCAGLSARKTGQVIKNLVGTSISASYISFNTDIAESVIESFRNRKLNGTYPVLYIDATYIPLFRNNVAKEAVYVVLGLRSYGKREILGYFLPEYVLESKTEEEARQRMLSFIDKWSKLYNRYFNNLKSKVKNYCYFFKFHPNIRSYLRTTNWLERCFKELKDNIRTRGYFQSELSANKFLYLFFSEKDSAFRSRKLRYSAILEGAFNG